MKTSRLNKRKKRDDRWAREIKKGNKEAFEALYHFYYPRLSQFVHRFIKSKQVSEDLVHNVFFKIWQNRRRLKSKGTLRSYLYTAVRNQAFKFLEKKKVRNFTEPEQLLYVESVEIGPERNLSNKQLRQAIKQAVEQIPEKRRQIFLMHREDELTYAEIAQVLGISIKTVETQMSRSLKFLRDELGHFLPMAGPILLVMALTRLVS